MRSRTFELLKDWVRKRQLQAFVLSFQDLALASIQLAMGGRYQQDNAALAMMSSLVCGDSLG